MINTDILIIGGGVPGLTLAALLRGVGVGVLVADNYLPLALKDVKPEGRTVALMQESVAVLQETGAWNLCESHGGVMQTLRIIDENSTNKRENTGRSKPVQVDFNAQEIGQNIFGINMPVGVLRAALAEIVQDVIPAALDDFEVDVGGVTAWLGGGNTIRARLIVGTDGRASKVRTIAGIKCRHHDYRQQAITCLIDHTKSHGNVSTEFHRPSGPFTLVPLPGNRSSVVWVDFTDKVDSFMAMNRDSFVQTLQDFSHGVLGEVTLVTNPQAFPLKALKAKTLIADRVALAAEAAHVLHPLGAQGLNLSLRDVSVLAAVLEDVLRLGQDPGSSTVLKRYENRRRQDVFVRLAGTTFLNYMVSSHLSVFHELRRGGLRALDQLPFLKQFVMRQGLAPEKRSA